MTFKLGLTIAQKAVQQATHVKAALNEMFAFEQACGCVVEQTYYHYPLTLEQMEICNQYRLVSKLPDGRVCLSRLGRDVAASC